ncbi:hypothetical protein EDD66_103374 [Mobilisporobacter senegalensis]|uniref:LiaF transmembrane domain-containing protein n=1 Tax=Mobilisporobacter senegalensis TaxID=1329262 RepID=A0A3N1XS26_9FIRM|nr:DUF5668 domain-containing protein [Mobilisporobacter senegalensis]ROR29436.1 hypothetical protein EDD66_103374 [Mobilisporobacter senegalensis]
MDNNMEQVLDHPIDTNLNSNREKTEIIRSHKVGTITLGASLIFFGILFITKTFTNLLTYEFILKLWPVIFILLGFEILISYMTSKKDRFVYDKGAIFLIILLSMFSICMACAEFLVNYSYRYFY